MGVYRALALDAEVLTGEARRLLSVISTSTIKNRNTFTTLQTAQKNISKPTFVSKTVESAGTHRHVIPPLRRGSHFPSPQYSHMFSSHCKPKNASGQRQNFVPFFVCMQTPPFLQKSLHSPAKHRDTILLYSIHEGTIEASTPDVQIEGLSFILRTETHCTGTGHPGSRLGSGRWAGCPG